MKKKSSLRQFNNKQKMDEFLEQADLGDELVRHGKLHRPKMRKINLDLPEWLLLQLDLEASRAGVSRQPLIKLWLIQKLDEERKKHL